MISERKCRSNHSQYQQQPYSQYQQPLPPQYQQPLRKPGFFTRKVGIPMWLLIVLVIFALGGYGYAFNANTSSLPSTSSTTVTQPTSTATSASALATTAPTQAPTPQLTPMPKALKWTSIASFSATGNQNTSSFTADQSTWKLLWTCNPAASDGSMAFSADLDDQSGNTISYAIVNEDCQGSSVQHGETLEYNQQGTFHFAVNADGPWTLTVQEQK